MPQENQVPTSHSSYRQIHDLCFWLALMISFLVLSVLLGCTSANEGATVGSSLRTQATLADTRNGAANTLTMVENAETETSTPTDGSAPTITTRGGGTWTGNSFGPNAYATLDAEGTQEMSTGVTPRRIYYDRDTGRLVVSSGSDITAKNVLYDGKTGKLEIGEFTTSASEPIRAGNEGLALVKERFNGMDAAAQAVLIEGLKRDQASVEAISPIAGSVLSDLIKALLLP